MVQDPCNDTKYFVEFEYHLQDTGAMVKSDKTEKKLWKNPNMTNNEYKTKFEAYVTV